MTLYTYQTAALALGLPDRERVRYRIRALSDRGEPLTVEAGELQQVGERLLITETGLERLRNFERRKPGPQRAKENE